MFENMNYKIINKINGVGEIEFYGEVVNTRPVDFWTGEKVEGSFIALDEFLEDVEQLRDKTEIVVRINTVGGDFNAGVVICNKLKELSAHKTCYIDGLCASAGTLIACGCDEVKVYPSSRFMIHGAMAGLCGFYNKGELSQIENRLNACEKATLGIYKERTQKTDEELLEAINNETWFTGQEIVDFGFADVLLTQEKDVNLKIENNGNFVIANGIKHNISNFKNFSKENIEEETLIENLKNKVVNAFAKENIKNVQPKEREEKKMCKTVEELRNAYPELVKQVETEAIKNSTDEILTKERQRISEIEEIEETIADAEMVKNAKFGTETMTAQELAFIAMKSQKESGAKYLQELNEDNKDAKVNDINTDAANMVEDDLEASDKQKTEVINSMKEAMKKIQK